MILNYSIVKSYFDDARNWSIVDRFPNLRLFVKGEDEPRDVALNEGDPILEEIDEFVNSIQTGLKPETDGYSGLAALALVRAAIKSARTGEEVSLEQLMI